MGYDLILLQVYRDKNLRFNLDLRTLSLLSLRLNLDLRTPSLVNIRNTPRGYIFFRLPRFTPSPSALFSARDEH
ncbi:uncharacterized protein K441DRAFT_655093 [Cenococcum geophilum 1.58]|uniref:uncharacterized protein n=1 Tax=Cenococcum geophilum 1.58 TaxID=794803 RepID=UPI00358E5FCC|nr:hypothetical protein K441DRAFT_655093 [Cenococcum geophilum 1.58]